LGISVGYQVFAFSTLLIIFASFFLFFIFPSPFTFYNPPSFIALRYAADQADATVGREEIAIDRDTRIRDLRRRYRVPAPAPSDRAGVTRPPGNVTVQPPGSPIGPTAPTEPPDRDLV